MKPEDQRIALATAHFPQFPITRINGELRHNYSGGRTGPVFDYLNDLNAVRMAEEALITESAKPYSSRPYDHEPARYLGILRVVVGAVIRIETVVSDAQKLDGSPLLLKHGTYSSWDEELKVIRATADQRCEALLKTLNLWQETETGPGHDDLASH